jgi:hypothetical protein
MSQSGGGDHQVGSDVSWSSMSWRVQAEPFHVQRARKVELE